MRLTIDNLDGLGAVDYSGMVDTSAPLKLARVLNKPSVLSGMLCLEGGALAVPVRRGRVSLSSASGTVLFTGYLTTEPEPVYAGVASEGAVYRLAFAAVSDEWLLDNAAALPVAGAALGLASGAALKTLVLRAGAGLATAAVTSGKTVGVYQPDAAAAWSVNAGSLAGAGYGAYRALGGVVSYATAGSVVHGLSDGDGSLSVAALKTRQVRELANDVTVSGETEPWAYVTELFEGDGTTVAFELTDTAFVAKASARTLVNDSFNTGVFDPRVWVVTDPGSHLQFSAAGLTLTGGNGFDGQTTLAAVDAAEIGGGLLMELGSVQLQAASAGILGGFYQGVTAAANCFAGYNVRQSGGNTMVVPMVNGAEVGTVFTAVSGHTYTFRLRLHSPEMWRVNQSFYATVDGAVEEFGGGLVTAPVAVVMDVVDLGVSSNTPATVLYDGVVANGPATCGFVPVNSVQLIGTVGYIRLSQTGSAWVRSTVPSGVTTTRLIGVAGEGVDCKLADSGSVPGKVTFFAGRVPVAGEIVTVTYRNRSRAVARMEDAASVAAEAAGGGSGTARWIGHVVKPEARTSADCESAAAAVLSFASARAAALAGSYLAVNPAADIWPGDVLALTANGSVSNVMVRTVTVEERGADPEALTYRTAFANDWAEGLGLTLSETFATDAVLPVVAETAPAQVLANLQTMTVVQATGSALQMDAGAAPPVGGGFEVRRRDGDFGVGVDQDLVLRSPVRGFAIPRVSAGERFYVRMYDGSTPPLYSRCSSVVIANVPVG